MLLPTFLSLFLTATLVVSAPAPAGPPYVACTGARQDGTGQGYAMFSRAAGLFQGDEWTKVWGDIADEATTETFFQCSDRCWRAGPTCKGVNYWHDDGKCYMFKNGAMDFVEGRNDRWVDTAVKGTCEEQAPQFALEHPEITCCNVWM